MATLVPDHDRRPNRACSPAGGAQPAEAPSAASTGLTSNVAGALAYFTFVPGVAFLVVDPFRNDRFIRFHAFQSILYSLVFIAFSIAWATVAIVMEPIPMDLRGRVMFLLHVVVDVAFFAGWCVLTYRAYHNETFQAPIIGPLAAKQAGS